MAATVAASFSPSLMHRSRPSEAYSGKAWLGGRIRPFFPPLKRRVLGCRHADRDGVSRFGRGWPQATGGAGAKRP